MGRIEHISKEGAADPHKVNLMALGGFFYPPDDGSDWSVRTWQCLRTARRRSLSHVEYAFLPHVLFQDLCNSVQLCATAVQTFGKRVRQSAESLFV